MSRILTVRRSHAGFRPASTGDSGESLRDRQTGFLVRANLEDDTYCVLWRPAHPSNRAGPRLRDALTAHREELTERLDALRTLLAGNEPERVERVLSDKADVRVTEVLLEPKLDGKRFAEFMKRAFPAPSDVREDP
jgi:hypothetical protein